MKHDEAKQVFDGLMLGDGHLSIGAGTQNARLRLSVTKEEQLDWLYLAKDALGALGVEVSPVYPQLRPDGTFDLWSPSLPLLTEEYCRWYGPNGRPKSVPSDLRLTPVTLAHWFMGDGSTSFANNRVMLAIASCAFGHAGNLKLQGLLLRDTGIAMGVYGARKKKRGKDYWRLQTGDSTTVNRFFDLVEPHVLPSFRVKVKRPWLMVMGRPRRDALVGPFIWQDGGWVKK
jgi:hypothetical protein